MIKKARMAAWVLESFNVIEPSGRRFCPSFYRPFSKNSIHHVIVIVMRFSNNIHLELYFFY